MRHLCLTLSRFALSAWVGAACLFIVTTLQDVHSPDLDSVDKAEIAVQRFPVYYNFAFSLLGTALVLAVCGLHRVTGLRKYTILLLVLLPVALTAIDYVWVYKPLEAMTANVEQARPAQFVDLHSASKWINTVQVSASVIAALALCWPLPTGGHSGKPD